jgi:hypothetical protein
MLFLAGDFLGGRFRGQGYRELCLLASKSRTVD